MSPDFISLGFPIGLCAPTLKTSVPTCWVKKTIEKNDLFEYIDGSPKTCIARNPSSKSYVSELNKNTKGASLGVFGDDWHEGWRRWYFEKGSIFQILGSENHEKVL